MPIPKKEQLLKDAKYPLIFLLIIFCLAILFVSVGSLKIRKIIVYGPKNNIYGLDQYKEQNLFFLDKTQVQSTLLKSNFFLKGVNINKKFPDTLELTIEQKTILATLVSSPSAYFLSEDGFVLGRLTERDTYMLPIISDDFGNIKIGSIPQEELISILNLVKRIKDLNIEMDRIIIERATRDATIELSDGTIIIFSLNSDDTNLPASLQIIISRFRIEGRLLSKIDFRFDKPIITLKNGDKISP